MARQASIKAATTANRVVRFMTDQHKSLVGAYELLRYGTTVAAHNDSMDAVLIGTLIILASFKESLEIACTLDGQLSGIAKKYESNLEMWHLFRHDATHLADRIFREAPTMSANGAAIPTGVKAMSYDRAGDSVSTGATSKMIVCREIDVAGEIVRECRALVGL